MKRLLGLALVATSLPAAAQPVAVFVSQTIDVREEEAKAFASVCTQAYAIAAHRDAVPALQAAAALKEAKDPAAAAKKIGAGEYITFELIRLTGDEGTSRIIATATRSDASGSGAGRADITLASFTDAPAACDRIVKATLQGVSTDQTRDRHNVTVAEDHATSSPARMGTPKVIGFKFAFGEPVGSGTSFSPIGSAQFNMLMEREPYFIEWGAGILVPAPMPGGTSTSYGGLIAEFGADYYLSEGDTAPFVGGGLEPRIIFSGSVLNLAPYAQVGLMFWRQSHTRLYAEARVAQNVLPVQNAGGTGTSYPTELSLQIGLGF